MEPAQGSMKKKLLMYHRLITRLVREGGSILDRNTWEDKEVGYEDTGNYHQVCRFPLRWEVSQVKLPVEG